MREKQRFVNQYSDFATFRYDTEALDDVPFRIKVQLLQYKLQLKQFYRENPGHAPLNPEWETRLSPSDVYLNTRLDFVNGLINSIPLQEHATNLS